MTSFQTSNFGTVSYESGAVLDFPRGLPAFEGHHRFLALQYPHAHPLVFLQSLEDPALCFITLPVLAVDSAYRLQVSEEDLLLLGLPAGDQPRIGEEVLCLAIVSIQEGGPTVNLLAPIVVNLKSLQGLQAIAPESSYSHQRALIAEESPVCS